MAEQNLAQIIAPKTAQLHSHLRARFDVDRSKNASPKAKKLLRRALASLKAEDYSACCRIALAALEYNEQYGQANHILAVGLEKMGEYAKALQFYERALQYDPDDHEICFNLAHLASQMKMLPTAEKLLRLFIEKEPSRIDGLNNLAICLRAQERLDDAIDLLKGSLMQNPENALLWNTLGTFLIDDNRMSEARTFIEEALRLDPHFSRAHHNLGFILSSTGPWDEALSHLDAALALNPPLSEQLESQQARALCLFHLGRLTEAYETWEVRHHPRMRTAWGVPWNAPKWTGQDLSGKRILLVAEQGLGDEIMFATAIRDVIQRVGPEGQVYITVNGRLVDLFARSFPEAIVGPALDKRFQNKPVRFAPCVPQDVELDYWNWFGSSLSILRRSITDFDNKGPYIVPDPDKSEAWRRKLQELGPGPSIGISWKSLVMDANRRRFYSAIDAWEGILTTPGATFINLQYGDCADDIARAEKKFAIKIHNFEELDLRDDIDGNAALCAALDLVITSPNAASAIAASVGTETWFITTTSEVWPQLGTDRIPFYPATRTFNPEITGDIDTSLADAAHALRTRIAESATNAA